MSDLVIEMNNLVKTYKMGDSVVNALDHISLKVYKGDFVAIIGPSGSGKSTLMNMIGCLDKPDTGDYHLEGKHVNKLKDYKLAAIRNEKIGFIFQSFNLLNRLTAYENVELPLMYRGVKSAERKEAVLRSLKQVGLSDRTSHQPNQLSGGQQQRVAIARALVGNPPILLADEPTGALDSHTSHEIMDILDKLNEEGHTIILITHDLSVASRAKRMIRISDGKLSEEEVETGGYLNIH